MGGSSLMGGEKERSARGRSGKQAASGKTLAIIGAAVVLFGCCCVGAPGGVLGLGWWQLGWFSEPAKKGTPLVAQDGKTVKQSGGDKGAGPPPNAAVTRANLDRLEHGMTRDE